MKNSILIIMSIVIRTVIIYTLFLFISGCDYNTPTEPEQYKNRKIIIEYETKAGKFKEICTGINYNKELNQMLILKESDIIIINNFDNSLFNFEIYEFEF